ncbi:MAG: hypothetical protein AAF581_09830 [Planctomycetota bacterium]
MLTRDAFLETCTEDLRICQHIATKLDANKLDYSPGEGMRNTLELMRYLTFVAAGPTEALIKNDWSVIARYQEEASTMEFADFATRMETQIERVAALLAGVDEDELLSREATLPWGKTIPLGYALVQTTLKFLTSYKLQLFCYAKASGATEMSTYNAWMGVDAPPK